MARGRGWRILAAGLAVAFVAVTTIALRGLDDPLRDVAALAEGIDTLALEIERARTAVDEGASPAEALAQVVEVLGDGAQMAQERDARIRAAIGSGKLDPREAEATVAAARGRLATAELELYRAALGAGVQQEDEDEGIPVPSLPPVPTVPLPEELEPAVDLVTPMANELAGRTCASTGATLALVLVVVPAVLPDLLEGLPIELPSIPVIGGDPGDAAVLALRNLITIHSIACGYVPVASERTTCDADHQVLEAIPPEVASAVALLGSPADLVPAPVGGAVATLREAERLAGQEGAASDELHGSLDCETRNILEHPAAGGGSGEPAPTARPVPAGEEDLPVDLAWQPPDVASVPAEVAEVAEVAELAAPGVPGAIPAPQALADAPPLSAAEASPTSGGGPWSWVALVVVLAVIAASYVPRERLGLGTEDER